jgi:hypothetical protein
VLFEGVKVELGDGLVLRSATAADVERVTAFNQMVHDVPGQVGMAAQLGMAVRSLMDGHVPRVGPGDFLVVEDTAGGAVVSSLCVIRHTWRYQDVPFEVGQVEFVGTHAAYRRRGLVRRQMELVHQRGGADGCLVQVIDGIDWYYRQFGYEYALQASRGGLVLDPPAGAGPRSELRTRPATGADADFLEAAYRAGMERYQVSVERDRGRWLADLEGYDPANHHRPTIRVIEDGAGRPAGFCSYWSSFHNPVRQPTRLWVGGVELAAGLDWSSWGRPVLDCLQDLAAELAAERGVPPTTVNLRLGDDHPLYRLGAGRPANPREGTIWYVRVDLPGFLRRVAPVLEERLARSPAAGRGGELALSFYRSGVRLRFDGGRIAAVEPWSPGQDEGDAWFPELTFTQLLLGYRSMAEIEHAYPDCGAADAGTHALLGTLFPKRPSYTWLTV